MTRYTLTGLAILVAILVWSLPAAADFPEVPVVYETVDAVSSAPDEITITGIMVGHTTPTTSTFQISRGLDQDSVGRCDRFALLAMAKPGKYQFATVITDSSPRFGCKLLVRAP
jgi:hypothetical protein